MMTQESLIVSPGPRPGTVRKADGTTLVPAADWDLLEPGDATLTRRVKAAGPSWTVQVKKGRKVFSHGVWAPSALIERERLKLEAERDTEAYAKRLHGERARRARKQDAYVDEFHQSVVEFLSFEPRYEDVAWAMAQAITAHATPVGSGTVARTERISIQERAERATIAWMRHQTTAYDQMSIPRVKGMRREVRQLLARRSRELLGKYRRGEVIDLATCPLHRALTQPRQGSGEGSGRDEEE